MIFKEFGDKGKPTVIFLHGGGLSWWSWKRQIDALQGEYHIVAPVVDGHGDAFDVDFSSIEKSAEQVVDYINENLSGHVHAICGLSLGAQITVEILARKENVANYAVIESGLVCPVKSTVRLSVPMFSLFYGLIKKRWYAKLQAKSMKLPENLFNCYFEDSSRITKETLVNMIKSNGYYSMPAAIRNTKAKVLILVGEKEISAMKKSARLLNEAIKGSRLLVMEKYSHGEISLANPDGYIELLRRFFEEDQSPESQTPII